MASNVLPLWRLGDHSGMAIALRDRMPHVLVSRFPDPLESDLAATLRADGLSVATCRDGEGLLEGLLREHPDAVIYLMHGALDEDLGILRLLRRAAPDLPLVLLTDDESLDVRRRAVDLKAIFFDVMPVEPAHLLEAVRAAVHRGRLPRA